MTWTGIAPAGLLRRACARECGSEGMKTRQLEAVVAPSLILAMLFTLLFL